MIAKKCFLPVIFLIFFLAATALAATHYTLETLSENFVHGYLDNGMEFALIEKHAAPVIAVIVTVKAGSRFETPENNGVSHFLEHLLFNGTVHRTQKQIYDEMDDIGAYNNASTSEDYVNFMILAAKENIDKAMDVQSDMLFNSTFPDEKFKKEKGIVIEEIGQNHARPDYLAHLFALKAIYGESAYGRPVLGTPNSIENMARPAVIDYYENFYAPNNMVLMAVGDFQTAEMLGKIDRWYGGYGAREVKNKKSFSPPKIYGREFRQMTYDGKNASLQVVFPAPRYGEKLFFAHVLLADLLNSDGALGLQKSFPLKNGLSLGSNFEFHPDFSLFTIEAQYQNNQDVKGILNSLMETLKSLSTKRVEAQMLDGLRNGIITENEINAERPHFYGMLKSQLISVGGVKLVAGFVDSLKKVTPDDISLALKNLSTSDFLALSFMPHSGAVGEKTASVEKKHLLETLDNGLQLIVQQQAGSDIFALHILAKNRSLVEPPGKAGIVDVMQKVMARGPADMSADEFSQKMQLLGAKLKVADNPYIPFDNYYTTPEFSFIRLQCLDSFHHDAVKLLVDMVRNPAFRQNDLQDVKMQQTMAVQRNAGSASTKARELFWNQIAPDSPYAKTVTGSVASVQSITVKDLRYFHRRYFAPQNLIVSVVSALPAREVMKFLKREFGALKKAHSTDAAKFVTTFRPAKKNVHLETRIGKMQSSIIVGNVIDSVKETERAALYIANQIFSSRIAFQLREKQGLAYRIGSYLDFNDSQAVIYAQMGTRPDNLEQAEHGLIEQFRLLREHLPDEKEIHKTVNQVVGRRAMRQLLSIGRAYLLGIGAFKYHDIRAYEKFTDALSEVTKRDVENVIGRYFPFETFIVVVAR